MTGGFVVSRMLCCLDCVGVDMVQEIRIEGFDTEVRMPRVTDRLGVPRRNTGKIGLEMSEWLHYNVGEGVPALHDDDTIFDADRHKWYSQVWFGNITYYFKDPQDATMFMLRWS